MVAGFQVRVGKQQVMLFLPPDKRRIGGWNSRERHWYESMPRTVGRESVVQQHGCRRKVHPHSGHRWWRLHRIILRLTARHGNRLGCWRCAGCVNRYELRIERQTLPSHHDEPLDSGNCPGSTRTRPLASRQSQGSNSPQPTRTRFVPCRKHRMHSGDPVQPVACMAHPSIAAGLPHHGYIHRMMRHQRSLSTILRAADTARSPATPAFSASVI